MENPTNHHLRKIGNVVKDTVWTIKDEQERPLAEIHYGKFSADKYSVRLCNIVLDTFIMADFDNPCELNTLQEAAELVDAWLHCNAVEYFANIKHVDAPAVVYSSAEPCPMCYAAKVQEIQEGAVKPESGRGSYDFRSVIAHASQAGCSLAMAQRIIDHAEEQAHAVVVPDDIAVVPHDGLLMIESRKARQERHNVVGAYFDRLGNLQEIREGSLYDQLLQRLPRLACAIPAHRELGEGMVAVDRALIRRLSDWFAWCGNGSSVVISFREELDALRANQGGAYHD